MAPGSIFHHTIFYFPSYKFPIYYFSIFYFPIYKPKIPKIFTLLFIYLYTISTGLIPWFSKAEGNTYSTFLHHPFLFKGKTNASSRGRSSLPRPCHRPPPW